MEEAVYQLYDLEYLDTPYNTALNNLMTEPEFVRLVPTTLLKGLHIVRKNGNQAAHYGNRVSDQEAITSLHYLFSFLKWFAGKYSEAEPELPGGFDGGFIPLEEGDASAKVAQATARAQLEEAIAAGLKLEADFKKLQEERDALAAEAQHSKEARARLQAQILAQQAEVAERKASRTVEVASEFSEAETRKHLIDASLAEAGWHLLRNGRELEFEVTGMPVSRQSKNGRGFVDYVLWGDDGQPLALVEAKRTSADPEKGRHQAWLYANALEQTYGRRPVIFYTNGYDIYLLDDAFYSAPRQVSGFLTKDTLVWRIQQRGLRQDIRKVSPKADIAGRSYQQLAIQRVTEALLAKPSPAPAAAPTAEAPVLNDGPTINTYAKLRGSRRTALLVMATGSGKTRTAAALTDILLNHGWARRILFLADRNALVTQAKDSFNEHLPEVSAINLTTEKENDKTRLVFSTYPTMLNRIEASYRGAAAGAGEGKGTGPYFGIGHFDLIIVDEAHRSVYNRYQAIFDYFDAMVLGLTATPRSAIDRNTYEHFGCADDDPTFEYPLDEAVAVGHLVSYQNIDVSTKFIREGIKYAELNEREKAAYEEEFRDNVSGELPEEIAASSMNKWLFNKDTVNKVLDTLMAQGLKIEGGDKIGRTIIFAVNKKHADFITECFIARYPELPSGAIAKIYNDISHADTLIKSFCNKFEEKLPQIAISVDMMDTGIDAPRVLNLVFFKVVRSFAKFWQMIGRGTRTCPDVFGPEQPKEQFLIFDVCQNFEFFAVNQNGRDAGSQLPLSAKIFVARLQLSQLLFQTGDVENAGYGRRLLDFLHGQLSELRTEEQQRRFRVRNARRYLDAYADRKKWDQLNNDHIGELNREIAPLVLPSADEESARRFDLLMLQLQILGLQGGGSKQEQLQSKLIQIATGLSKKFGVPEVLAKADLIHEMQNPEFYPDKTSDDLDHIRTEIRNLLIYLSSDGQKPIYTNFTDGELAGTIGEPLPGGGSDIYRRRVEAYLREHRQHVTIRKLRNNEPITPAEMDALNDLLFQQGPLNSREEFSTAFPDKPLTVFVRRLLGMEESAARAAFAEFLHSGTFSADQMTFLENIISYLTKNGIIDPGMLFEAPFTDLHDNGILGVFDDAQAQRLVAVVRRVNGEVG